ncbi:MAG: aminotransferase class III-fold pyridoxal phosphate-dependent enzyme, partial [Chlamydiota bacterium]|nr:aminotransferase class III-fold pyridoxal phosphate-dependent enzyme [Chlamydiota bacterium]
MGANFYQGEPIFRDIVDHCADLFHAHLGQDLRKIIYPDGNENSLNETIYTQSALFTIEYALAKLLMSWGIQPQAMIGHSIGEFVCACLARVMTLEDTIRVVANRGRLMQNLPSGKMLSVRLSVEALKEKLNSNLSIAGINGPSLCVVSGEHRAIDQFQQTLEKEKVACRPLQTSHAFHSPMMDPIIKPFCELVRSASLSTFQIPFVSTATGTWITQKEAQDPMYWAMHLRKTVRFADGITLLWNEQPDQILIEVGPRTTLCTLAKQQAKNINQYLSIPTLSDTPNDHAEYFSLLKAIGNIWFSGGTIDWPKFYANETRHRIALPTYPFERKRFWIDPIAKQSPSTTVPHVGAVQELAPPIQSTSAPQGDQQIDALKKIVESTSGFDLSAVNTSTTFFEMGLDSLFLTQVALKIQQAFHVKVSFRQLLEEFSNLELLSEYISQQSPSDILIKGKPAEEKTPKKTHVPSSTPSQPKKVTLGFGPSTRIHTTYLAPLTSKQQSHLNVLIDQYTERTKGSKLFTQKNRHHLADPRVVSGFRPLTKEMTYPIVVNRSAGSKLWDIDGNEYVDVTCGFGSNFLGFSPPFLTRALNEQLKDGIEIGPQHPLSGEVATLIQYFTGFERVAFCNTGSEAVLGALRLARTVTGKDKIVLFKGAYHGIFDEVIVHKGIQHAIPAAPGIPPSAVENILVLDYGSPESLQIIENQSHELAAVLVEPVQSRQPELQPKEFLHALKKITQQSGSALIFDEVITGFRIHPGGAQAHFGVQADIASYGKVIGGGLPIGVIAGMKHFMDAFDGGHWQFGDASAPEVGVTYFAGTFVRHPLALRAAKTILEHLKHEGPKLQETLNQKTDAFVSQLNKYFEKVNAPILLANFGSLFKVKFTQDLPHADLLYFWLRHLGVHIWDHRPCFLTISHSEEDIHKLTHAFKKSIAHMQEADLLPINKSAHLSSSNP